VPVDTTLVLTGLASDMFIGISLGGDGPTPVDTAVSSGEVGAGLGGVVGISFAVLFLAANSWLLTMGNGDGVASDTCEWESGDVVVVVVSLSEEAYGTDLFSDKKSLNSVW
jgi:hypothetical protein